MKWAILIPTMLSRRALLQDLQLLLAPQIEHHKSDVVALVSCDTRTANVADRRNKMLDLAAQVDAEYVSFIDDDDRVSEDYVSSILPLLDGVDTVQFQQSFFKDGVYIFTEERGLRHHGVFSDGLGHHYRDISHLSATRRELVLPFRYVPSEDTLERHAEDSRWGDDMRIAGRLKTEHVIDKVLYKYLYRSNKEELCLTS